MTHTTTIMKIDIHSEKSSPLRTKINHGARAYFGFRSTDWLCLSGLQRKETA